MVLSQAQSLSAGLAQSGMRGPPAVEQQASSLLSPSWAAQRHFLGGDHLLPLKTDGTWRRVSHRATGVSFEASALPPATVQSKEPSALEITAAKELLLAAVEGVERGASADSEDRAEIEEAQVNLECLGREVATLERPGALDLLHGLWRLRFSNASDVMRILRLPSLGPLPYPVLQVGDIYQNFICRGRADRGVVQNVVDWSIPGLLQADKGARFMVKADFTVQSSSSLLLLFKEAGVDSVRLSELAQAALAPAVLPRTQPSMEVLQFIQGFDFRIPLQTDATSSRQQAGGRYILTYLDETMLIGRATAPNGSFIFERVNAS